MSDTAVIEESGDVIQELPTSKSSESKGGGGDKRNKTSMNVILSPEDMEAKITDVYRLGRNIGEPGGYGYARMATNKKTN